VTETDSVIDALLSAAQTGLYSSVNVRCEQRSKKQSAENVKPQGLAHGIKIPLCGRARIRRNRLPAPLEPSALIAGPHLKLFG
jgi:hypothetical protein